MGFNQAPALDGTLRFVAKQYTHIEDLGADQAEYFVRFRLQANDEERLVGDCQTSAHQPTDDPKKVTWKGHMKIQVTNEMTDTLFYFEVYNQATDKIVS